MSISHSVISFGPSSVCQTGSCRGSRIRASGTQSGVSGAAREGSAVSADKKSHCTLRPCLTIRSHKDGRPNGLPRFHPVSALRREPRSFVRSRGLPAVAYWRSPARSARSSGGVFRAPLPGDFQPGPPSLSASVAHTRLLRSFAYIMRTVS